MDGSLVQCVAHWLVLSHCYCAFQLVVMCSVREMAIANSDGFSKPLKGRHLQADSFITTLVHTLLQMHMYYMNFYIHQGSAQENLSGGYT